MEQTRKQKSLIEVLRQNKVIVLLFGVLIGMLVVGEVVSDGFASYNHIRDILRTASFIGLCAIGQTLVILTGGIDLTIGSLITMDRSMGVCLLTDMMPIRDGLFFWFWQSVHSLGC